MTSPERLYALYQSVRYVIEAGIPGSFVECGVWKGGSVMMIALTLRALGVTDRDIVLFDTFTGMTPTGPEDIDFEGRHASEMLKRGGPDENVFWAKAAIEEVRGNLRLTGYDMARFRLVAGDVLKTIPVEAPQTIALLRLDTDWYESTRHELQHLFPLVVPRGVLIIDDYGHFRGARKAVDDYFADQPMRYLLNRIDYTGRVLVKA